MLDYSLSADKLAELRAGHRATREKREADRIKAVILLAGGWSAEQAGGGGVADRRQHRAQPLSPLPRGRPQGAAGGGLPRQRRGARRRGTRRTGGTPHHRAVSQRHISAPRTSPPGSRRASGSATPSVA